MSYIKMAKKLVEVAGTGPMREATLNVESTVHEFREAPGASKQDIMLAMGYAVHYCDYEAALPAQENLMRGFERIASAARSNPTSAYIAGASLAENLRHVRDAMKNEMASPGSETTMTFAMEKGGRIARAVYEATSDGAQSAILTVAEALSRDWDKDNTLDC